jgi:predicted subunit of tRNA(5-methylaminomethyl-2-thiouridylate) methyltransferase
MSLIPSETTETPAVEPEAPQQTEENTEAEKETLKFLYDEGIEGTGDAPEWFKASKYKSIADQAKGYSELEKRLGSFTGAPKDGKYEIEGVSFEDNPLMQTVAEWGVDNQLSSEGLGKLIEKVNELAQRQIAEDQENATKALGENAQKRLSDLAQWGKNNLSTEEFVQFQGLAQNAGQVQVLEKLIGMAKNSKIVKEDSSEQLGKDDKEAEIRTMQFAKNEKGQRLMDVDPEHRKKVLQKMKELN